MMGPPATARSAYAYQIGKYEVTAGQYTEFLNAVADSDTYGLYSTLMGDILNYGANIQRTGSSPNYSYSVAADWANRPVNYVSFWDAARFANWLHNGQPTGPQGPGTTEDGAVPRCRHPDAVSAQRRREILHPHRERVVQGGLPQSECRPGSKLLRLSDGDEFRAWKRYQRDDQPGQ